MKKLTKKELKLIKKYPNLFNNPLFTAQKTVDYRIINGTPLYSVNVESETVYWGDLVKSPTDSSTIEDTFCLESFAVELDERLETAEETLTEITPKVERALLTPLTTPTENELVGISDSNEQLRIKIGDGLEFDETTKELQVDTTTIQTKTDNDLETTDKTIVGAINELNTGKQKKIVETVLWTNPSPTSSFSAQTITLSGSVDNYDMLEIEYHTFNGSTAYTSSVAFVDTNPLHEGHYLTFSLHTIEYDGTNIQQQGRVGNISPSERNKILFGNCGFILFQSGGTYAISTTNDRSVPHRVIGIKYL